MNWHLMGWGVVLGALAWIVVHMWTDAPPHRSRRSTHRRPPSPP